MKHMLRWGRVFAAVMLALMLPVLASAQNDGRFTGAVLDPSGAVVAGAVVAGAVVGVVTSTDCVGCG